MKIGILTFHSQLNYGGVLQCWALQRALQAMGHEVQVIDRWLSPDNWFLERGYNQKGLKDKIRFWLRSILGCGDLRFWLRCRRTKRFVRSLHLSPYHFCEWSEAPKDLGLDCIVVGSDQVWNPSWKHTRFYLMEDAPRIMKIAYAASIGARELPCEQLGIYRLALSNFKAVSCREQEACDICRKIGIDAVHVVDPTQLLTLKDWTYFSKSKHRRMMTCYFLSEDVDAAMPELMTFAKRMRCEVRVLVKDVQRGQDLLPLPVSLKSAYRWLHGILSQLKPSLVKIVESAGPIEFVRAHADSDWIMTDSFHSLMFATIYGKNVRVLRPHETWRQQMFSRMEEFAAHATGPLISDDIASALDSFSRGETAAIDQQWLSQRREKSLEFLRNHLTFFTSIPTSST